jgi:hypothetical protein
MFSINRNLKSIQKSSICNAQHMPKNHYQHMLKDEVPDTVQLMNKSNDA